MADPLFATVGREGSGMGGGSRAAAVWHGGGRASPRVVAARARALRKKVPTARYFAFFFVACTTNMGSRGVSHARTSVGSSRLDGGGPGYGGEMSSATISSHLAAMPPQQHHARRNNNNNVERIIIDQDQRRDATTRERPSDATPPPRRAEARAARRRAPDEPNRRTTNRGPSARPAKEKDAAPALQGELASSRSCVYAARCGAPRRARLGAAS